MISQMVVSPTGSGKTVMGLLAAKDFVTQIGPAKFGVKPEEIGVCWVAMRRNLLDQTEEANWMLTDEATKPHDHGELSVKEVSEWMERANDLVLCPNFEYVSMFDKDAKERMAKYKVVFMVVDEAQHDAASTMVTLHSEVAPDIVLGLSATPMRTDNLKLCFQREIRDAGYRFLIQDGYLSQFNHWVMREWTPESVARLFFRNPDGWGKSLAFFLTRAECEKFASYIRDPRLIGIKGHRGREIEVVHGGSNKRDQLERFDRDEIHLLVSMAVLSEGFDCPSLQTVFVRDTRSKGVCIQMSGRVLRIWVNNHGDQVTKNIVQSAGTQYPFTRFAHAASQFVEEESGKWTSIGSNDRVDKVVHKVMNEIASCPPPTLPEFLLKKQGKRVWTPPAD